jgi:hypothetical protein
MRMTVLIGSGFIRPRIGFAADVGFVCHVVKFQVKKVSSSSLVH